MVREQIPARGYQDKVMNSNTAESVKELLKRTEQKRVSVLLEDALTESKNIQSPQEINTVQQLQFWADKDLKAFLELLREHQLERDQALNSLKDYNRLTEMVEKTLAQANQAQVKLARSKEEVTNLQAEVVLLRTELKDTQERVTQLTEELIVAENTMAEMTQGTTPQFTSVKRSAKFPDPPIFTEEFTEEDVFSQFESWILHIHDKLQMNQDHFESQAAQTAYVLTCLSGMTMSHINSYHTGDPTYFKITDSVLSALKDIYNDLNRRENSRMSFRELKQDLKTPFP